MAALVEANGVLSCASAASSFRGAALRQSRAPPSAVRMPAVGLRAEIDTQVVLNPSILKDVDKVVDTVVISEISKPVTAYCRTEKRAVYERDQIQGRLQLGVIEYRRQGSWVCFAGGPRQRRPRQWNTKQRRGTVVKSQKLLNLIAALSNVKEEVYGALDAWSAWELEFPLVAVKKALTVLQGEKQWRRVIQVSKWMFSKGQGKTMGTYLQLLRAFDEEGRVEEAEALWEKLLTEHMECIPRTMFGRVMAMYEHHNQPKRLLQVFADMEDLEVRPDEGTVERVARTYERLGLLKRQAEVLKRYAPTRWEYRYVKGRRIRFRVTDEEGGSAVEDSAQAISLSKRPNADQAEEEEEEEEADHDYGDLPSDGEGGFEQEEEDRLIVTVVSHS